MDRTARIYKIESLLRQRSFVSFADFLVELEVSRSTLKRDLEYLRTRLNAPIEWVREAGGYQLARSTEALAQSHELPGLWFSPTEIHALLTMQHLLAGIDTGGLLAPHLSPLMDRLNALLGSAKHDAREVRRRVRIIAVANRPVQAGHFQTVASALLQRRRLGITYAARHTGQTTAREVSPLRLVHNRGNWYLDAWCHLRQSLRSFALDAIGEAHVQEQAAKEVDDATLDATFLPSYGIFSGKDLQWAVLHFNPERTRWVKTQQWHPQQEGELQADGSYLLRIPYADPRELIMDILQHGSHCEVLGPVSLREAVVAEVLAMGRKYL